MKVSVELEYEQIESIVRQELKEMHDSLDPAHRASLGIFEGESKEELKRIKKLRKSIKDVLEFYGAATE